MLPVSIVTTVLNEAEDLPRLVASLLTQDPPATEILVVDGGSTDGTWEWLQDAASRDASLRAIRDETCSLKFTPGPVSKGRNVAIAAAKTEIIACADAGCTYAPNWVQNLTDPIARGETQYALGGSCLNLIDPTLWDLASAPFFGVKLLPETPTKSCTARSMAFTRALWRQIGGFPESVLLGEDTQFDLEARKQARPAFVHARAMYRPQNSFLSACRQMTRYALSDGILGVRRTRLVRNAARCVAQLAALLLARWTWIPLEIVLLVEIYFAFRLDWLFRWTWQIKVLAARLLFSILVPWIVTANQVRGALTKPSPTNAQNARNQA
jgi:glycosyltransferase involved in cell wall biosynthesis